MLANCRNFRDAPHNCGAFQRMMRERLPELPKKSPVNHDVVQIAPCTIPEWNAPHSINSLAKPVAIVIMRVIPYEGNP